MLYYIFILEYHLIAHNHFLFQNSLKLKVRLEKKKEKERDKQKKLRKTTFTTWLLVSMVAFVNNMSIINNRMLFCCMRDISRVSEN